MHFCRTPLSQESGVLIKKFKLNIMEIIKIKTKQCLDCSYYKGYVIEKYNGKVSVVCHCDIISEKARGMSPVMIGFPDGKFRWKPISNNIESDGKVWHNPYFSLGNYFPAAVSKRKKKIIKED